jgi:threonine/homoserine/homoserine lactone efflux protein
LLAVVGLAAVLYASEVLFNAIRYAGAAYLFYLGVKTLRAKAQFQLPAPGQPRGDGRLFLTGMATSVLNPKGILLFLAYFPQFVAPDAGHVTTQLLTIGMLFTAMCGFVYGAYGYFSSEIGARLSSAPRFADIMRWITGSVLIGLGLRLMAPERR